MLSLLSFLLPESFSLTSVTLARLHQTSYSKSSLKAADIDCTPTVCQALCQTLSMSAHLSAHLILNNAVKLVVTILPVRKVRLTSQ